MIIKRKPEWLKIKLTEGQFTNTQRIVEEGHLNTICVSGKCPNIGHCWNLGTATFMICGDVCTRSCKFCSTKTGKPMGLDANEPQKVADSIQSMHLKYCVITSVDRDDLPDQGVAHWVDTITKIKNTNPTVKVEVLVPDFDAKPHLLDLLIAAQPHVFGHNMETVRRITPLVRSRAKYDTSLKVLEYAASKGMITKSGIMVGLGETSDEVIQLMKDLRAINCQIITIGQYLQPTKKHAEVEAYIHPDQFAQYKAIGLELGFRYIESGPFVRSSYMAENAFNDLTKNDDAI